MPSSPMKEPHEVVFGRVAIAVAEMLERDMDEVLLERIDGAGSDRSCPYRKSAAVANRISILCRRLSEEIQRYERYDRLCRDAEEDQEEENEDPVLF